MSGRASRAARPHPWLGALIGLAVSVACASATPVPTRTPIPEQAGAVPPASAIERHATEIDTKRNVTYCRGGRVSLKMDVYSPRSTSARPRALVLYVHGGGFVSGDKDSSASRAFVRELNGRGYVAASVNYRLAPAYRFPAMLEDVKCAVRHFRANARSYGIDPSRIGIIGSSAGGQLAALVGVTDRRAAFEGAGGYGSESSRVQAVVDLFGWADMTVAMPRGVNERLLKIFGSTAGLRLGSPVTHATSDDPPILIMHGDRDATVPLSQSQLFAQRLRAVGVPTTLQIVTNADHGFDPVGGGVVKPSTKERLRLIGEFLDRYLKLR